MGKWGLTLADAQGWGEGWHIGDVVVQGHHYVSAMLMLGAQYAGHSIDVKGHMVTNIQIDNILKDMHMT